MAFEPTTTGIFHRPTSDGIVQREVRVYRNLTKGCWSVQARIGPKGGWRVMCHLDALALRDATFKVSEAGRDRVVATKRKNVHAYVYGTLRGYGCGRWRTPMSHVSYNPYRMHGFQRVHTAEPVREARLVAFDADGKVRATRS